MNTLATFSAPKSPNDPNEDRIVVTSDFVVVIDGATEKNAPPPDLPGSTTPGAAAAERIAQTVPSLPPDCTPHAGVNSLTEALAEWKMMTAPPAASVVVYSRLRREVWVVGSAMVKIGAHDYEFEPRHESSAAGTRAAYLSSLLAGGATFEELCADDSGREIILPLLKNEYLLRNVDTDSPWHFGTIDGTKVPTRFIKVLSVPPEQTVITLASDGYPKLLANLIETEHYLAQVLKNDPLMIRHPKTKGLRPGNDSFDDRSYVQFET